MYCPSNVVFNSKRIQITLHTIGDYNFVHEVPKAQRFNPLRYSICWMCPERSRVYYINLDGWSNLKVSNGWFRVKKLFRKLLSKCRV